MDTTSTVQLPQDEGDTSVTVTVTFETAEKLPDVDAGFQCELPLELPTILKHWKDQHPQWLLSLGRPITVAVIDEEKESADGIRYAIKPGQAGQRVRPTLVMGPRGERTIQVRLHSLTMKPEAWHVYNDRSLPKQQALALKSTIEKWWATSPTFIGDRDLNVQVSGNPWESDPARMITVVYFVEGIDADRFDRFFFEGAQGPGLRRDWLYGIVKDMLMPDVGKGPWEHYREFGPMLEQPKSIFDRPSLRQYRYGTSGKLPWSSPLGNEQIARIAFRALINEYVDEGLEGCPACHGLDAHCPIHHAIRAEVMERANREKDQRIAQIEIENARLKVQVASQVTLAQIQEEWNARDQWLVDRIGDMFQKLADMLMASLRRGVKGPGRRSK